MKETGIKVIIKPDSKGLATLKSDTERTASGMKKALSSALDDGLKGGKEALKGMVSDIKSVVGTVSGLLGGIGLAELIKGGVEANSKIGDLAAGIRFAGGTARDAAGVMDQLRQTALETAQDSMKMIDVFEGIRRETGSIDFATDSIEDVATAARGAHRSLEQMGAVTGTLSEKFGIVAGSDLRDTLADVVGLSEKGGVSFDDMAQKLGLIGAYAKEAGLSGRAGFQQMVGMLNLADNANGSFKKGITGVGGLLEQLGNNVGKNKIGAALGISMKDLGGNAGQQIEAIMKATKGQKAGLERAFGGEQLKLLVDIGKTYSAALDATAGDAKTKQAGAAAALHAALSDAGKSAVTWADIQTEAAAEMKEAPQTIAVATEKLRQAFQSEKFQAALAGIINKLPALAEWFVKIASWTIDNPGAAITGAIVANIGKAAIGEAIGSAMGSLFKAFPGATIGVGLLAAAAVAAAEAISDYNNKVTNKTEDLDATPALIKKAKAEMATTGGVSKDTLDELARRRADFEGVKKAGEEGGVENVTHAVKIAAKYLGGADEITTGRAATIEASKLGAAGVESTIADLDALIGQAVKAKGPQTARQAAFEPGFAAPSQGAGAPVVAGAGAPRADGAPPIDPQALAAANASALAGKTLNVWVKNANDIGGGSGGGPTGKAPVVAGYLWRP